MPQSQSEVVDPDSQLIKESERCMFHIGLYRVWWEESGCCGRSQGVVVGVVALAPAKSLWHTICQFA